MEGKMAVTRYGTNGGDTIYEDRHQDDIIYGLDGNDTISLYVNDDYGGDNQVDAGAGDDFVFSDYEGGNVILLGAGNDIYVGQGFGSLTIDHVDGGAGNDLFYVATRASNYYGGAGDDAFYSSGWQNRFEGGEGNDMVSYQYATKGVQIALDWGQSFTGAQRFETLISIENAAGSDFADEIYGDAARNYLYGNGGADTMNGQGGDDYVGGGAGNDTVSGGAGHDWVFGDEGDDLISGDTGFDYLYGGTGNDTMSGGTDWDWIEGAAGADRLTGGTGNDFFIYRTVGDSGTTTATRDVITDFTRGQDMIDLSMIDARASVAGDQAFTFVSSFTGAGGQVMASQSGGNTFVFADLDGDRVADLSIQLNGSLNLTASDFIL
jgi:Ca2+-binding RTX toxin-like protein